jgi:hypothetical protein
MIGLSMAFSPLTANIYFPGLVQIQNDLSVTPELVDLTITSYLSYVRASRQSCSAMLQTS